MDKKHELTMNPSGDIIGRVNNQFKGQLKTLRKDFPHFSKDDITNFFEYNGNDMEKTRALLNSTKKPKTI